MRISLYTCVDVCRSDVHGTAICNWNVLELTRSAKKGHPVVSECFEVCKLGRDTGSVQM